VLTAECFLRIPLGRPIILAAMTVFDRFQLPQVL
jgi:hypothetical protein